MGLLRIGQARKIAWLIGVVGVIVVLAASGCDSDDREASSPGGLTHVDMLIGTLSANPGLAFIARDADIFKKNGLDVTITVAGGGSLATAALVGGSGDFVSVGGADLFAAQAKGQHIELLAKALGGLATQIVLTPQAVKKTGVSPDAPVNERVKALNGLTLASTSAASSWTAQAQKAAATEGAEIKFTYLQTSSTPAALKQNNIDGAVNVPPVTTDSVSSGTGVLWLSGPARTFPGGFDDPNYASPIFATTEKYSKDHPEIVKSFVKSIIEASDLVKSDGNKAGQLLKAAVFKNSSGDQFQAVWKAMMPLMEDPVLTVDSIQKTMELEGADGLNPSSMYPADLLDSVTKK